MNLDHAQLSKGGIDGSAESSNKETFQCSECGKPYTRKDSLQRHKKFYCPNVKGLDPLEKEKRMKNQADVGPDEVIGNHLQRWLEGDDKHLFHIGSSIQGSTL